MSGRRFNFILNRWERVPIKKVGQTWQFLAELILEMGQQLAGADPTAISPEPLLDPESVNQAEKRAQREEKQRLQQEMIQSRVAEANRRTGNVRSPPSDRLRKGASKNGYNKTEPESEERNFWEQWDSELRTALRAMPPGHASLGGDPVAVLYSRFAASPTSPDNEARSVKGLGRSGLPDEASRSLRRLGGVWPAKCSLSEPRARRRSLEPRGFEPLSRQDPSSDFHGNPLKCLNKGSTAEAENDGNEWKLLDVTSTPRELLPADFLFFSNG